MDFIRNTINLRRVVVTGMGILCPLGKSAPESWENLKKGKSGISRITRFDVSEYPAQTAGEVKDYDPLNYFDRKEVRKYDPYIQFALIASEEALKDSMINLDKINKERANYF